MPTIFSGNLIEDWILEHYATDCKYGNIFLAMMGPGTPLWLLLLAIWGSNSQVDILVSAHFTSQHPPLLYTLIICQP